MRKKIYNVLNKIYGITMTVSFFAGILPLIPFIIAIIIGGSTGEAISLFLYKQFYPWVILLASISVIIGLIAMYVSKSEGLSLKSVSAEEKTEDGTADSDGTESINDENETNAISEKANSDDSDFNGEAR